MIVTGSGEDLVAASQHVLPHNLRRYISVAGLGEVAVGGASNEAAFALWIEPACRFPVWYYWSEWRALSLLAARTSLLLLLLLSTTTTTAAALSAASTLIASATPVVTVITIAVTAALFALSLPTSISPSPISPVSLSAAALRAALRIVL